LYRKGSYTITLTATNDIGIEEKESVTVYITNVEQCYLSEINILGVSGTKVSLKSYAGHSAQPGMICEVCILAKWLIRLELSYSNSKSTKQLKV